MWLTSMLESLTSTGRRRPRTTLRKRPAPTRLPLEALEDRCLPSFLPAVSYAVSSGPGTSYAPAVVVGDFNSDGTPDLVVASPSNDTVSVLLGNRDGTFAAPRAVAIDQVSVPVALAVGDFNGDGKLDLAVAQNARTVAVLLGNGDGTFQAAKYFAAQDPATGAGPASVAVGDLNGDGKLDLVVISNYFGPYGGSEGYASVLLGDGQGGFSAPTSTLLGGGYFTSVAVADFNGDGKPDVATTEYQANAIYSTATYVDGTTISVLLNDGLGNLQGPTAFAAGSAPAEVAAGDVNGDGHVDLVVANSNSNTVSVLLGNGQGSFASPQNYATGGNPTAVALADFNKDGRLDIATANGSASASVLLGNGNGNFQSALTYATPSTGTSAAVGDFNGDGFPDLAVANTATTTTGTTITGTVDSVSVLLNAADWSAGALLATSFAVSGFPSPTTAGVSGGFTVTAKTGSLATATGYTGIVHFSSSDTQAGLPADYTFTAADQGVHTFSATLKTAGTQSLTVTDTVNGSLTGTDAAITVNPAAASKFILTAPAYVTAGASFSLTLTVEDAYGNVATGYTGTVHFSSTDSRAKLPKDCTFTAADQGVHTFTGLVLRKKGNQKITITDTHNSSLTGSVIENVL